MNAIVTLCMKPAVDLFCQTERLVEDAKSRCQIVSREAGGGGINVARNLHSLGADVLAVLAAGGDSGRQLQQMLADDHLPLQYFDIADSTVQNIGLNETATDKMYHLVFPGQRLQESEWQACLDYLNHLEPAPTYLVLSGSLPDGVPDDFYGRLARVANGRGTRVILDSSGRALAAPLQAGVFVAKLNRNEFTDAGYQGSNDRQEMLAAMGAMVERGLAQALIVTLGADGALLASRDGDRLHVRAPRSPVASHVGAGDSFVSLLTFQLSRGQSLVEAYRYGVAAAAAKVRIKGNHLNDMALVESLYRQLDEPPPSA